MILEYIVTGRNEIMAKVIFLHLSIILFTRRRCLPQCMLGYHTHTPPGSRHTPRSRHPQEQTDTPQEQTPSTDTTGADTPPWSRHPLEQTPPRAETPQSRHPLGSRLQHTVNEWPVHILLECIIVNCKNYNTN